MSEENSPFRASVMAKRRSSPRKKKGPTFFENKENSAICCGTAAVGEAKQTGLPEPLIVTTNPSQERHATTPSSHVRRRSFLNDSPARFSLDSKTLSRIGKLEDNLLLEVPADSCYKLSNRRQQYYRESSFLEDDPRRLTKKRRKWMLQQRSLLWLLTMIGIASLCFTFTLETPSSDHNNTNNADAHPSYLLRAKGGGTSSSSRRPIMLTEPTLKMKFVKNRKKILRQTNKKVPDNKPFKVVHNTADHPQKDNGQPIIHTSQTTKDDEKPTFVHKSFPQVKRPTKAILKIHQYPLPHYNDSSATTNNGSPRIFFLDKQVVSAKNRQHTKVEQYPSDRTDDTQLYPFTDSNDEPVKSSMERRIPIEHGDCKPLHDWQTSFYPSCNSVHELGIVESMGKRSSSQFKLFGTKGYWRNAWRVDSPSFIQDTWDTFVLKTLKLAHRFEERHYEHDRIDAVAMERLTASPHVIDIFGFCGHSVMTEFADGKSVGELADKAKKKRLKRLEIARDIASGLADIHDIDGDGTASLVHYDINPANVVSIGGRLKFNDFNIAVMRTRNETSGEMCGIPSQYPNPQWRSPEEAKNSDNLTEKIDVFSMGHIFYRLICGHGPWNKIEPGGKPDNEVLNEKVKNGTLPFVPEDVLRDQNPEVVAIREAMFMCYTYDPVKRPSAKEIMHHLQKSLDKLSQ